MQKIYRFHNSLRSGKKISLFIFFCALFTLSASVKGQEENSVTDSYQTVTSVTDKYAQLYLPPVVDYNPPIIVGPAVTTTYYNPPVWVNNYPPVVVPGPVIVRSPWRPFLRTFIP